MDGDREYYDTYRIEDWPLFGDAAGLILVVKGVEGAVLPLGYDLSKIREFLLRIGELAAVSSRRDLAVNLARWARNIFNDQILLVGLGEMSGEVAKLALALGAVEGLEPAHKLASATCGLFDFLKEAAQEGLGWEDCFSPGVISCVKKVPN